MINLKEIFERNEKMKALSMKQPVPELILEGKKTIELRHWNTSFRGEFLLHSSLNELKGFDIPTLNLPKGALVGKAELVDVIKFNNLEDFEKLRNQHLASSKDWFIPGKTYGFVLRDVQRLERPVPLKGKLNFFEVKNE